MVMPFSTIVCFETSWIVEDWNCTRFWDVLIRDLRYYHNPIFTPEISFRVGTQNKAIGLSQLRPESVLNASKSPQNMAGAHFMRFGEVWPMLTKFDQSWLSLTEVWPRLEPGQRQDLIDHFLIIEKSTSRPSIRHFTGRKRTINEKVMGKTVKILLSIIDQNWPILGQCSCTESSRLATSCFASLKL